MFSRRRGLTENEIQHIIDFNWDNCEDEDDKLDDEKIVEKCIEEGLREALELDLIERLQDEEVDLDHVEKILSANGPSKIQAPVCEPDTVKTKIDVKNSKWRKKPLDFINTTWDNPLNNDEVIEVKIPFEYFHYFIDENIIDKMCSATAWSKETRMAWSKETRVGAIEHEFYLEIDSKK